MPRNSSRDLVQMMAERGILLAHTTILRWVQRYVPDFEKALAGVELESEIPSHTQNDDLLVP